jgi:hypothetical protein
MSQQKGRQSFDMDKVKFCSIWFAGIRPKMNVTAACTAAKWSARAG